MVESQQAKQANAHTFVDPLKEKRLAVAKHEIVKSFVLLASIRVTKSLSSQR